MPPPPRRRVDSGVAVSDRPRAFVSRGGEKLAAALEHFGIQTAGLVCADLGSHVGGFVDCLLQSGAGHVYSIDTAYGILAWKLRKDPRVTVLERTNALHVRLPESVDRVTIDVGWTPQRAILANVRQLLGEGSDEGETSKSPNVETSKPSRNKEVLTLIKPHYEARADQIVRGVLPEELAQSVLEGVLETVTAVGWHVQGVFESPLRGHGGNREFFAHLRP